MDVVASLADADMRYQKTAGFRGGIVEWANRWNRAMDLHVARLGQPRHHALCLEDLIAGPHEEWKRLCNFLDLDQEKGLLSRPDCVIADMEPEPWKHTAFSGLACTTHSKATELFGPQSLAWLREHLGDSETIRGLVREQHCVKQVSAERQNERPAWLSRAAGRAIGIDLPNGA